MTTDPEQYRSDERIGYQVNEWMDSKSRNNPVVAFDCASSLRSYEINIFHGVIKRLGYKPNEEEGLLVNEMLIELCGAGLAESTKPENMSKPPKR